MSISGDNPPPRAAGRRPAWARGKFFQCSLVTSDVLGKPPSAEGGSAEEVLEAFFYQVPAEGSRINLGVQVVCKSLTLYLVLEGIPSAFLALKQVCLAYDCVTDVAATGDSGCVVWSDSSIQRILRYDRVDPQLPTAGAIRALPSFATDDGARQRTHKETHKIQTKGGKTWHSRT